MNGPERRRLGARLLGIGPQEVHASSEDVGDDTSYVWQPVRGGGSVLVHLDGTVLYATSSVTYDRHLAEFNAGRRTPLEAFD